jgi:hypothetical protein
VTSGYETFNGVARALTPLQLEIAQQLERVNSLVAGFILVHLDNLYIHSLPGRIQPRQ